MAASIMAASLTSNLEYALYYSSLGWEVFPAHTIRLGLCSCGNQSCKSQGKHPMTQHGLSDATTNHKAILKWWNKTPDANIAIRTGKESGLAVLDIDTKSNGFESLEALENTFEYLPESLTSITGSKGNHVLFSYPGIPIKTRSNIVEGIDFRGDGGYIIAPPSLHNSGNKYEWVDLNKKLLDMPEWLIELVNNTRKTVSDDENIILEGHRNSKLMSMAGKKRSQGESLNKIRTYLLEENQIKCKPPLDHSEVLKIVQSVCKYEKGKSIFKYIWKDRVLESNLLSSSKLLLLTLFCHMDSEGRSCYPSQKQLKKETSMDLRTIRTHTEICINAGFIQRYVHKTNNQEYWNYGYIAALPD